MSKTDRLVELRDLLVADGNNALKRPVVHVPFSGDAETPLASSHRVSTPSVKRSVFFRYTGILCRRRASRLSPWCP